MDHTSLNITGIREEGIGRKATSFVKTSEVGESLRVRAGLIVNPYIVSIQACPVNLKRIS